MEFAMRKQLALIALVLAVALCGCGKACASEKTVALKDVKVTVAEDASKWSKIAAKELKKHLELISEAGTLGEQTPSRGNDGGAAFEFVVGVKPEGEAEPQAWDSKAKAIGDRIYFWGEEGLHGNGNDESDACGTAVSKGPLFAVYEFLDKKLGVKWVFPGDDGIVVKPRATMTVVEGEEWSSKPHLEVEVLRCGAARFKNWRKRNIAPKELSPSRKAYEKAFAENLEWLNRQRLGSPDRQNSGHAFGDWQDRYFKDHPEYFAYIIHPDLYRGVLPGRGVKDSNARRVHLCVSNPAVVDQIIADWQAAGAPRRLNICPNDGKYCFCHCEQCLALDEKPADYRDSLGNPQFFEGFTDRYLWFYNRVAEAARKVREDVDICAYIYSVYRFPPKREKLEHGENFFMEWVPSLGDDCLGDLEKWRQAGLRRFELRPNYQCYGSVFPRGLEKFLYDNYHAARKAGAVAADYDGNMSGFLDLEYYVIASSIREEDRPFEDIVEEFYDQFGAAREAAKKYFERIRERNPRIMSGMTNYKVAEVKDRLDDGELARFAVAGQSEAELAADLEVLKAGLTACEGGGFNETALPAKRFKMLCARAEYALRTFRFLKAYAGEDEAAFMRTAAEHYEWIKANKGLMRSALVTFSNRSPEYKAWQKFLRSTDVKNGENAERVETIGVIMPASILNRTTFDTAYSYLTNAGYRVKLAPRLNFEHLATAEERARDLEDTWLDPEVDLVLCARGGSGAEDTVRAVDWEKLRSRPDQKLLGFSNITMILNAMDKKGVGHPFSGSSMSHLCHAEGDTAEWLRRTLAGEPLSPRKLRPVKPGAFSGRPCGGHIHYVARGLETGWNTDWSGRVVVLERNKSAGKEKVRKELAEILASPELKKCAGIIFGDLSLKGGTKKDSEELIAEFAAASPVPVYAGLEYGHIPVMHALDFRRGLSVSEDGVLTFDQITD